MLHREHEPERGADVGDPVTSALFLDAIDRLRRDFHASHTSLRTDMTDGFRELSGKLDQHADDDRAVEKRVYKIELERDGEEKQSMKRGTWAALIGAAGLTAAWEGFKKMAGW